MSKGSSLPKNGKGEAHMTNAELILQLVDKLLNKLLKQKEEIETLKSTKANTKDEKIKADNT